MLVLYLLGNVLSVVSAVPAGQCCRCFDTLAPCWPDATEWDTFNQSISGRLVDSPGRFDACIGIQSDEQLLECLTLAGNVAHNYISADMNLAQATGSYRLFDMVGDTPDLFVRAKDVSDVVATVNYTRTHGLRLSIKNTGHDWYGRQIASPSLQLWTHEMNGYQWHDTWSSCDGRQMQHALTVEAGVQWVQVLGDMMERGRYTTYGTSMSVGAAGGFMQAGGFAAVTGQYGSAADNIREMTVVTADGEVITANACNEHQELFWAIRGGGGGTFGVVVDATYETYEGWENLGHVTVAIEAGTASPSVLRRKLLEFFGTLDQSRWSFVYADFYATSIVLFGWVNTYTADEARGVWQPLGSWLNDVGSSFYIQDETGEWLPSDVISVQPFPIDPRTGKAILNQEIYDKPAARPNAYDVGPRYWFGEVGFQVSTEHWTNGSLADYLNGVAFAGNVDFVHMDLTKALSGKFSHTNSTSLNPTVYDALGHVYTAPTTPGTDFFNAYFDHAVWPPEMQTCATSGEDLDYTECFNSWPDLNHLDCMAAVAGKHFPNAGSYMNENDPLHPRWQMSQWGVNYDALLAVKNRYDPMGLFVCHHCVGSEQCVMVEQDRGFCLADEVDECLLFSGDALGNNTPPTPPPVFQHRSWDAEALDCVFTPDEYAFTSTTDYYNQIVNSSTDEGDSSTDEGSSHAGMHWVLAVCAILGFLAVVGGMMYHFKCGVFKASSSRDEFYRPLNQ